MTKFTVTRIWPLNTKVMDEKISPSEVFITIETREDKDAYSKEDDEQVQEGEVFLDVRYLL